MLLPRLLALATAVPPHRLDQEAVRGAATLLFDRSASQLDRLLPVYDNAGITGRNSCVPLDWYTRPHGWSERNALFVHNATELLAEAGQRCLDRAGLDAGAVDMVVAVSTTGLAAPSLDALLIDRLGLRRDVARLPVFGLGCAGGVIGLSRAVEIARARPGQHVLFLVVELCALTFRHGDNSKSNVIASALFGDGAAAALISTADWREEDGVGATFGACGEYTWPDSGAVMGWRIEDDGFGVLFSRDIPALIADDLGKVVEDFLARHGLTVADLRGTVCHPGGAKVLDALAEVFAAAPDGLEAARDVLREHGNMSAVTVLMVLERMLSAPAPGLHLMVALGPGFSAGFQLVGVDAAVTATP